MNLRVSLANFLSIFANFIAIDVTCSGKIGFRERSSNDRQLSNIFQANGSYS
jgi:hypothetical protein